MTASRSKVALAALLLGLGLPLAAQTPAAAPTPAASAAGSAAKKELVARLLQLQQPGLEGAARTLVERPAAAMMQQAGAVLQTQVAADQRESIGKGIEADVRKYVDEVYPRVREQAIRLAPTTIGPGYEEKFSEDELRQLIAWFESPLNHKFQQVFPDIQRAYLQKLATEARPLIEPSLRALEQKMRTALSPTGDAAGTAPKGNAKPAAKAPAAAASR